MKKEKTYNYFYKIENTINGHYYYGIHSTDNINDSYMGSGKRLLTAYKKYGVENFKKTILKYFDNREELSKYENEHVTESLINDDNCYNIILGGERFNTIGMTVCYDKILKENVIVKTEDYYNNERYDSPFKNKILVQDKNNGEWIKIEKSKLNENRENYKLPLEGKILVKNSKNEFFFVDKDNELLKNGMLKPFWTDRHHTEETKRKISEANKMNKSQVGEKNSQFGTCWINRNINGNIECIKIKKEDINKYIKQGWVKGRKILKKIVHKNSILSNIDMEEFKKDFLDKNFSIKKLSEKYNLTYSYTYKIIQRKIKI